LPFTKDLEGTRQSIINRVSNDIWREFACTLQRCHLTKQDTEQQTWIEWLKLEQQWPTNPGKYLHARMIDWIRYSSGYNHHKGDRPFFISLSSDTILPSIPPHKPELRDLIAHIKHIACDLSPRHLLVVEMYLEGYTLKEIGMEIGVTESRACQLYKEVVRLCQNTLV